MTGTATQRCSLLCGREAGYRGQCGSVVGVDGTGQIGALKGHGVDIVMEDLAELLDVG